MTIVPQCAYCARYLKLGTCEAYPKGIPRTITRNEEDHRKPLPGDHELQFVARLGQRHPMSNSQPKG